MVVQDLSEAIEDYTHIIAIAPDFALAYFNRAASRYKKMIAAESDNSAYELEQILRDYSAVIKINPDFVFAWYNRGNMRCVQKDFRAAISDYNEAIERNPDFAEAWYNRGLCRLYLGNTERGIEDLSRAGELGLAEAYRIIKKMASNN